MLDGQEPGVRGAVRELLRQRGLRGFASGMQARMLTLAPLFTVLMGGYELLKRGCMSEAPHAREHRS